MEGEGHVGVTRAEKRGSMSSESAEHGTEEKRECREGDALKMGVPGMERAENESFENGMRE